jgi:hypothetical protein
LGTSCGGVSTGERGDRILLDDPHNVIKAESDTEREKTVRFVRESMSKRLNDEPAQAVDTLIPIGRSNQEEARPTDLRYGAPW